MWQDNDDRIMDILDGIGSGNKGYFPVDCPICEKKEGHIYFHRNKEDDQCGGMQTWCSACYHTAHATCRLPRWWKNPEKISTKKLTSYPGYLEENKNYIDEWVNKLLYLNCISEKT